MSHSTEYVEALEKRAKQLDELIGKIDELDLYDETQSGDCMGAYTFMERKDNGAWLDIDDVKRVIAPYRSKDSE